MKKIFLLFILFTSVLLGYSQVSIDSIKLVTKKTTDIEVSIKTMLELSQIYFTKDSIPELFENNRIIDSILNDIDYNVSPVLLAKLAWFYENMPDYDKAIHIYRKASERAQILSNNPHYIQSNNRLAYLYSLKGDNETAISVILKNLALIENKGYENYKESVLIYAAIIYRNNLNIEKAFQYFTEALEYGDSTNNKGYYSTSLHELGNLYSSQRQYEKALTYQIKAMRLREKNRDTVQMGYSYHDISITYRNMGNFEKAIDYINLSIKLSKAISDQWTLSNAYLNMSLHYEMMNENKLSKVYADSSEVISFKMGLKQNLNLIHFQYYKYYNQLGDYKKALDHYITSDRYKDSVSGENIEKQINFLNAQFQSERKDKEIIRNQLVIKRQRLLIYSFIIGVLTIGGFLFWLIRLYRRLKIYNVNLAKANEYITFQKEEIISQRDEIEQQRDTVMNQKILLEHINLHLTESIEYAVNIQETMLPSSEQFSSIFPSHFIFYKPLDLVSGDFYWLHRQNNQVFFAVADCTGHGVSGAFMSLLGISFLNEIIKIKRIEKPNEILDHLRQEIIESMKQKQAIGTRRDGMDIALCVINLDTKVMDYSGANNPCWIVTKDKEVVELKPDKNPVSIYLRMQPFSLRTVQLQSNDSVYLFTDGFADQFGGPQNKRYYISNLMKFVLDHHKIELTQVKEELEKEFISWKGSNNQIDDVTILGIRV